MPPKKETEDSVGTMIGLVKRLEQVPGAPAAGQIRQDIIKHKKVNPRPSGDEKARLVSETTIFWDTYYKLKSRYEGDPSKGKTKMGAGSPAATAAMTAGGALAGTAAVAGGVAAGAGGMGLWGMLLTAGGLWLALKLLKKNPKVKAALEDIGGMMWDKVKEGWEWFSKQFPELGKFVDDIIKNTEKIWDGLKKEYPEFFAWMEKFQTRLGEVWDALGEGVDSIWKGIKKKYEDIKNSVSNFFTNVGEAPSKIGEWLTDKIEKAIKTAGEWLHKYVFDPLIDEMAQFVPGMTKKRAEDRMHSAQLREQELLERARVFKKRSEKLSGRDPGLAGEYKILQLQHDMLQREAHAQRKLERTEKARIGKLFGRAGLGPKEAELHRQKIKAETQIALEEFQKRIKKEQELRRKAGLEPVKLDDFLGFGNKLWKINRKDEIMGAKAGGPISALLSRGMGGSGAASTVAGCQLHEAKRTNVLLEGLVLATKSMAKMGGGVSGELTSLLDTLAKSQAMGSIAPQSTQFDDTGPMGEATRMTSSRLAYYQSPHSLNTPIPWGSA